MMLSSLAWSEVRAADVILTASPSECQGVYKYDDDDDDDEQVFATDARKGK